MKLGHMKTGPPIGLSFALVRISHRRPATRSPEIAGTAQTPNTVEYSLAFYLRTNWRPKFRHFGRLLVAGLQICEKCGLVRRATGSFSAAVRLVCLACALLVAGAGLSHGQLIPTPEFSQHEIPTSLVPSADHSAWEYLDVAVLAIALALASYFALVTRSRRHLLILTIASLLWFGFWRKGCVCPIGATQNVALAMFDAT